MSAPRASRSSDLVKHFPLDGGLLQRRRGTSCSAVDGVSFDVARGETLGLVGESGCGKSTVGKMVLKLIEPTARPHPARRRGRHAPRRPARCGGTGASIQIVFQDPYSSLNPRLSAGAIVGEPLENFGIARGAEKDERVAAAVRARRPAARGDAQATRTSSPAASASGSASPGRWRSIPT